MPQWTGTTLLFLAAMGLAWALCYLLFLLALRALRRSDEFWRSLVARTRGPIQLGLMVVAGGIATNIAPLPPSGVATIRHLLLIAFIACVTWVARTALDIWMTLHLRRFRIDV